MGGTSKKDKPDFNGGLDFEQGYIPLEPAEPVICPECQTIYFGRPKECLTCGYCFSQG